MELIFKDKGAEPFINHSNEKVLRALVYDEHFNKVGLRVFQDMAF